MSKALYIHIEMRAAIKIEVFEDHASGEIHPGTDINELLDQLEMLGFARPVIGDDSFFATE